MLVPRPVQGCVDFEAAGIPGLASGYHPSRVLGLKRQPPTGRAPWKTAGRRDRPTDRPIDEQCGPTGALTSSLSDNLRNLRLIESRPHRSAHPGFLLVRKLTRRGWGMKRV